MSANYLIIDVGHDVSPKSFDSRSSGRTRAEARVVSIEQLIDPTTQVGTNVRKSLSTIIEGDMKRAENLRHGSAEISVSQR